jgi:hypothetical protein
MSNKTKVTFAIDVTTADGKNHAAGTSGVIPAAEARELIYWGRARLFTKSADTEETPADPPTVGGGDAPEGNTP